MQHEGESTHAAAQPRAELPPSPTRRVGDYALVRSLGRGGMGEVFLAEDPSGATVAVKVMHPHLARDPEFLARMRSEVAAARRVSAWSTARVLDADLDADTPYVVTEYVEGPTLAALVERAGPMSPASAQGLALGVALALAGIHDAGVVHRDLKPGNVILSPSGPRVIDFGVALHDDRAADLTRTGVLVGSVGWMSPEQVRGEPVTAATDVFSWGALVHHAATGRRAFGSGSTTTLVYRIAHVGPDLSGTPPELLPAVRAAMDPDPSRRPTARDLVHILQQRGRPSPAPETGSTGRPAVTLAGLTTGAGRPPGTVSGTRVLPAPRDPRLAARPGRSWRRPPARAVSLLALAALAAVLAVAVVVALTGDGEQTTSTTRAAAVDVGAGPAGVPGGAAPSEPAVSPGPASPSPTPVPSVVDVGDWSVEPLSVECGTTTLGEGWVTAEADGEFCVVGVSVTNTGDEVLDFAAGAQEAGDRTGVRYRADGWAWVYHAGSRDFAGLEPGATVTGDLVFDVPPGTALADLAVRDGWAGDTVVLPLAR